MSDEMQANLVQQMDEKQLREIIALEITKTAAHTNAYIDPCLQAEFERVFSREPAQAIEWAFRTWREQCSFFPTIHDVHEQIGRWKREGVEEPWTKEKSEQVSQSIIKAFCRVRAEEGGLDAE